LNSVKIIGVAGGSCCGKTLLVDRITKTLGPEKAVVIEQDAYYFGLEGKSNNQAINFDHPDAIDFNMLVSHLKLLVKGHSVEVPMYDFKTHTRKKESILIEPREFVFVEGTLIFASSTNLVDVIDHKVFIKCDEDVRKSRRLNRDVHSRGRTPDSVETQFRQFVKPMHDIFVTPSKVNADRILNQEECNAEITGLSSVLIDYFTTELSKKTDKC
jgi:uridine kinase